MLLTVSGVIPPDVRERVASRARPRVDYLELAASMGADLIDYGVVDASASRLVRLVKRVAGANAALAFACFRARRSYDVIVTDGEQIGLPLACLLRWSRANRRARHMMIVHVMSVPKKVTLFRVARLRRGIDRYLVYASAQRDVLVEQLGVDARQVTLAPFMVDSQFFDPAVLPTGTEAETAAPIVCSAGLELRDYPTLVAAATGLNARVVLAAASPWSKRSSGLDAAVLPSNVEVVGLDLFELRRLYGTASIVVVPLQDVDFQAGITTILEAMAMARPVVCTRTVGQTDTIVDGDNGVYVQPGDPVGLRRVLDELLGDATRRAALGDSARQWVLDHADIERYTATLTGLVDDLRRSGTKAQS